MKGLGIAMIGILAVAGGIAAAAYITKKKLEKQNEEDYYDEWDDDEWDDMDFDFDEEPEEDAPVVEDAAEAIAEAFKAGEELIEEETSGESSEEL